MYQETQELQVSEKCVQIEGIRVRLCFAPRPDHQISKTVREILLSSYRLDSQREKGVQ